MSEEARLRTAAQRIASLRPPESRRSAWWSRLGALLALALVGGGIWSQCGDRPAWRGLALRVDGPEPTKAPTVFFFLHGHGGSNADVAWIGAPLRAAGLPADAAIVFVEAPYASGGGRDWGDSSSDQMAARDRVQLAIGQSLAVAAEPPQRVFIGGFSQGAQLAARVAAVDTRIDGVVLLSPCSFIGDRFGEGVGVLVAHGKSDRLCKLLTTEALVERLETDRQPVTFVAFDGDHEIAPAALDAMGVFLAPAKK